MLSTAYFSAILKRKGKERALSLIARAKILEWSGWEMHYCQMKTDRRNRCQLVVALLLLWACLSGRANVYATNIKLNGSTNNAAMRPGRPGADQLHPQRTGHQRPALQIYSGAIVVWTNSLAGTNAGSNSVVWGGTNQAGTNVAAGNLSNQHHGGGRGPCGLDQHHR